MKSLIVANWKMNPSSWRDAKKLFEATKKAADKARGVSIIVAPPALYLRELASGYKGRALSFAAQNAHFEAGGAFTGEISMQEVHDAKASHVLIGHAERRKMGETDGETRMKVIAALNAKLTPILCVGEHARSNTGEHFSFVARQLSEALMDVPAQKLGKVIVGYEPVWAIGAEKPMGPRDMHEMAIFIRKKMVEKHGQGAMKVKILYGGSIDETNAAEMLREGGVDGFVLGRASYNAEKFSALTKALSEA